MLSIWSSVALGATSATVLLTKDVALLGGGVPRPSPAAWRRQMGGYRYTDFVRVGLALNLLTWAVAVTAIHRFLPF